MFAPVSYSLVVVRRLGADSVQARTIANLDSDILEEYGDGNYWIVGQAWEKGERCDNNNYLESSKIDVGHGVCGDPPQVSQWLA